MNIFVLKAAAFAGLCSFAILFIWLKLSYDGTSYPILLLYAGLFLMGAIGTAAVGLVVKE